MNHGLGGSLALPPVDTPEACERREKGSALSPAGSAAVVSRNGKKLVQSADQREVDAGAMKWSEPKPTETPESGFPPAGSLGWWSAGSETDGGGPQSAGRSPI